MSDYPISVRGLTKTYHRYRKPEGLWGSVQSLFVRHYLPTVAVNGIGFVVRRGVSVGLLGPNGAGKTSTIKMLTGVVDPTSGQAEVLGYVPWRRQMEYRRQIALVMGSKQQLWWDLPAIESFQLYRAMYGIPSPVFRQRVEELASLLKVTDLLRVQVRLLSLGERMKMELIGALLHAPSVVFLDEPTIGLDVVAQHSIREFLREYVRITGATLLLTSHNVGDIASLCDQIVVINSGTIVFDGSFMDFRTNLSHTRVVEFALSEPVDDSLFDGYGEVIEFDGQKVKMSVDREQTSRLTARLLADNMVSDLTIQDEPIEDIIRRLYAKGIAARGDST